MKTNLSKLSILRILLIGVIGVQTIGCGEHNLFEEVFGDSSSSGGNGGNGNVAACDPNGTNPTVAIGNQVWMKCNLDVLPKEGEGLCIGEDGGLFHGTVKGDEVLNHETGKWDTLTPAQVQENCAKYGRLYSWSVAMDLPAECDDAFCAERINKPHRGLCPEGFHIPTLEEWEELILFVDGQNGGSGLYSDFYRDGKYYNSYTAGKQLKSSSGWLANNGTDKYGFAALPGSMRTMTRALGYDAYRYRYPPGENGYWWTATEDRGNKYSSPSTFLSYAYMMSSNIDNDNRNYDMAVPMRTYSKSIERLSIRCIKD
jgi:uncharacterized protein (TIGR02145 family)